MLDANILAEGHEFFSIGGTAVSAGQTSACLRGGHAGAANSYRRYLKNLTTGELLPDVIP